MEVFNSKKLITTLQERFENNTHRHKGLAWTAIQKKLETAPDKLRSLYEMERTGGAPDVVYFDAETRHFVFYDCSIECPAGRRSLCYDREAQEARKANKPKNSAMELAAAMGVELLTEKQYRSLQQLGDFDNKTSSWLKTPAEIRKLGGAIFGDFRFNHVFIYHNGAQSYYATRGFRASLRL